MHKTKTEIIEMFVRAAEKFVAKVDGGCAHSHETYNELKECLRAACPVIAPPEIDKPLSSLQTIVLRFFRVYGPMTDEGFILKFNTVMKERKASAASLRSRRAELVALGKLRNSLSTVLTPSGRKSILWETTPTWITKPLSVHVPPPPFDSPSSFFVDGVDRGKA